MEYQEALFQIGKSYYEYIDQIADRLGVTIDYLVRGKEIKTDALSSQEMRLVENFRCLTAEAKDVITKNVILLANLGSAH